MIIKFILFNILIGLCKSIKIKGNECSCEDFFSITACENQKKCSINGNLCGDLICENRSEGLCDPKENNYKCKWDAKTQKCQEYAYTCSEIPLMDCSFNSPKELNCVVDSNQNCVNFSCGKVTPSPCPNNLCSFSNKQGCQDKQVLNCSTLSYDQCDFYYDGNGHVCNLNDENKCKQYNLYGLNIRCSEWNDSQQGCTGNSNQCIYDGEKKVCRELKCTEITNQDVCKNVDDHYNEQNIIELCKWSQGQCLQLELADIARLTENECLEKTGNRFVWKQNYGCQPCKSVEIINSDPDLCYQCYEKVNSCPLINSTFPLIYPKCLDKDLCYQCYEKVNSCPLINSTFPLIYPNCFNNDNCQQCYEKINSCPLMDSTFPKTYPNCFNNDNCQQCYEKVNSCPLMDSTFPLIYPNCFNNDNCQQCYEKVNNCSTINSIFPNLKDDCFRCSTYTKITNCSELTTNYYDLIKECCSTNLECSSEIWIIVSILFIVFSFLVLAPIILYLYNQKKQKDEQIKQLQDEIKLIKYSPAQHYLEEISIGPQGKGHLKFEDVRC